MLIVFDISIEVLPLIVLLIITTVAGQLTIEIRKLFSKEERTIINLPCFQLRIRFTSIIMSNMKVHRGVEMELAPSWIQISAKIQISKSICK